MIKNKRWAADDKKKGFTFVETLVAVGIFGLLMVGISSAVLLFYQSNSYVMEQSYAVSEGRQGVENMVEDIRQATYAENGAYPIEQIDHHKIIFYADTDQDTEVEQIKYFIENEQLKKKVTEPSGDPISYTDSNSTVHIASDSVRNIENSVKTFTYYDKSGSEMPEMQFSKVADMAFVEVNLVVNIDPSDKPRKFTLRSSASLRNID